ncbi:MAG: chemotaxis protein CheX [Pseudomonadota bacterium]
MDVKFINPFLQGTLEVINKMAFIEPRPGKAYLKENSIAGGDVSGIIGITGDAIGTLAVSFSETCICDICSRLLGELHKAVNQDVFDAVGEITNMISGVARTHMEKEGMAVYAAIPSVVYGKNHTINHILDSPSIVIPFSTDQGAFVVDVCIKKTTAEMMRAENYQVVNRKTATDKETSETTQGGRSDETGAAAVMDKMTFLKKKLKDVVMLRDDMARQLAEKPFMEISKRKTLKKRIPLLDAQIKRLKLDISAMDVLSRIKQDDLDNPKLVRHYQQYEVKKRRP